MATTRAPSGFRDRGALAGGPAGGDHVLDHHHALARRDREAATQRHGTLLALGEAKRHAERRGHLVADDHAAQRRREHRLRSRAAQTIGERRPHLPRALRQLQEQRALHVSRRVQSGGETEVPAAQSPALGQHQLEVGLAQLEAHSASGAAPSRLISYCSIFL